MIIRGNFQTAQPRRQAVTILTGDVFGRTNIIEGAGSAGEGGPHAYLVEQSPGVVLPPHFHLTDQFQVVVAGDGMLGRSHELSFATVHYARAKTAYGPLVAGAQGLSYLTLRPRVEYGGHYLSDPKTVVDRRAPKFQTTGHTDSASPLACAPVIAAQQDGLAVWQAKLAPGDVLRVPEQDTHAGRFCVVLAGSAVVAQEVLPPWSCVWMSHGEQPEQIMAGPEGAELLTLQFPNTQTAEAPAIEAR